MFFLYFKVCTVAIKIVNHQLIKSNWPHNINIFQNWTKNKLKMLLISYTIISQSFILTLKSIQEKQ